MRYRKVGAVAVAIVLCQSPASLAVTTPTASPKAGASTHTIDTSAKRKGFNVVRKHRRGKAQLCGYTLNGYRYVLTRANSRKARKKLTYRLRIGEWDPIDKDWDPSYPARERARVKRGKARHVSTAGGPLRPRVRVQIRSRHGRTTWSGWKRYRDLKPCPDWYVRRALN